MEKSCISKTNRLDFGTLLPEGAASAARDTSEKLTLYCIIMLKDSMRNDPEVFASVYKILKKYENKGGFALEAATLSPLDSLFDTLPKETLQLESYSDYQPGFELDVYREEKWSLPHDRLLLEAIVQRRGRPSLWIQNGTWQDPGIPELQLRLNQARTQIAPCLDKVGRIDGEYGILGSGWLFDENRIVTNAHVAVQFCGQSSGSEVVFEIQEPAFFNNAEQPKRESPFCARLDKLLAYSPLNLDIAIFELKWREGNRRPGYLSISDRQVTPGSDVMAIGYPADDSREHQFDLLSNFEGDFEVKRLSPGRVMSVVDDYSFLHDCSTLGGSSGSPIISLDTGLVVGLHFAGKSEMSNRAINTDKLAMALKG